MSSNESLAGNSALKRGNSESNRQDGIMNQWSDY